ncbi:alpha/beta hydrolase [Nonlabens xiamenensis]|uniref:alpha/beta hydrolase n=1 Tax=Nonlabens xiamenensis TaxID=2341043 RepID=UPI000F60629D|nr:alpha/beta hydrolase-fold protein [Nonlabens xiamenensis]
MSQQLSLQHLTRPSKLEKAPLLILLHGYGSNEEDLFSFAPELDERLFIISVRAPYELPPYGAAWYAINFDPHGEKFSDDDQARESMQKLMSFIEEVKQTYPIDPAQISLLGFSQGAILSYGLSLSHPREFQNVVAMSGYINEELIAGKENLASRFRESANTTHFFISHGNMDQVVPFAWGSKAPELLKEWGIPHVFNDYPVGHGVARENFYDMKKWLESRLFS